MKKYDIYEQPLRFYTVFKYSSGLLLTSEILIEIYAQILLRYSYLNSFTDSLKIYI